LCWIVIDDQNSLSHDTTIYSCLPGFPGQRTFPARARTVVSWN
jgi:hypothetical protein